MSHEVQRAVLLFVNLAIWLMVLAGATHAVKYVTAENMQSVGAIVSVTGLCMSFWGIITLDVINKSSPVIAWSAKRVASYIAASVGEMVFLVGILMVING